VQSAAASAGAGPPEAGALIGQWSALTGAQPSGIAVLARPLDGGPALIDWNGATAFNPASTMKIVTTYAALDLLGPHYRWSTTLHLDGALRAGVLEGHLVLRGGGDPKFVIEDLTALIGRMRAAGLTEIRGDLLIDDSLFDLSNASLDSLDGDRSQPYNVAPHAALMNFKATRIVVRHDPAGQVRIALDPPLADVKVRNELKLLTGACGSAGSAIWVRDQEPGGAGLPEIRVQGRFAPTCGEQSLYAAVLDHQDFIHGFFKAAWRRAGGRFDGRTRIAGGAARSPVWMRWESPRTLIDVVQDINKFSNNVMTRQLLLTLATRDGRPATPERARQVVANWLTRQGLRMPELVIDNGSGLSRSERISAASLTALLAHAAASSHGEALRDSLPKVGHDGTMRGRLSRHPVAGRAWIKTGSLRDVRSIAGYVDAASGRRHAVAMIANGDRLLGAQPAQDAFLRWVHEHG
jgi:D-alanyl-D-alanine carboxypeptidase/D-alanyl-D-alanine-endopeptidase (penicillin-binding protein 4)